MSKASTQYLATLGADFREQIPVACMIKRKKNSSLIQARAVEERRDGACSRLCGSGVDVAERRTRERSPLTRRMRDIWFLPATVGPMTMKKTMIILLKIFPKLKFTGTIDDRTKSIYFDP